MPTILDETKFPGMPAYPEAGKDYEYTLEAMKGLPFDIWVAAHASQFDLHKKHAPEDGYRPDAFFDHDNQAVTLELPHYALRLHRINPQPVAKLVERHKKRARQAFWLWQ